MDTTTMVLALAALILVAVALYLGDGTAVAGVGAAASTLRRNLPIILLGFTIAGLVQVMVPAEWIGRWLGAESGTRGVLAGCLAGGLVPGAPYAVFPLVGGFYRAGASLGAVVGFVTAWSLWSVSRLPMEMALIDPKPALIRYAVTLVVPPIAGILANAASRYV